LINGGSVGWKLYFGGWHLVTEAYGARVEPGTYSGSHQPLSYRWCPSSSDKNPALHDWWSLHLHQLWTFSGIFITTTLRKVDQEKSYNKAIEWDYRMEEVGEIVGGRVFKKDCLLWWNLITEMSRVGIINKLGKDLCVSLCSIYVLFTAAVLLFSWWEESKVD